MKNKVKCPNGHYYNADVFGECPMCGAVGTKEPNSDQGSEGIYGDKKTYSKIGNFFETAKNRIEKSAAKAPTESGHSGTSAVRAESYEDEKTEAIFNDVVQEVRAETSAANYEDEKTEAIYNEIEDAKTEAFYDDIKDAKTEAIFEVDYQEKQEIASPPPKVEVKPVSNKIDNDESKTYAVWEDEEAIGMSPVCGWLVCINGVHKGKSFEVKSGNNNIGRGSDMDISLAGEPTVSRKRHSVITYDSEGRTFYLQQGESSGTTYLNNKIVLTPAELTTKDKIKIGKAEFIFVEFCDDDFNWEENL